MAYRGVVIERSVDVVQGSRDLLLRVGLVTAAWLAWLVPWPLRCVLATSMAVFGLVPRGRIVRANVGHVRVGNPPGWLETRYLALQQIATHWKMIFDLMATSVRPEGTAPMEIFGVEHLEPHLGQRGIVAVAPHAGPYPLLGLLAGPWLRRQGFRGEIVVVARLFRPFRSGALMTWVTAVFARAGVTILPVDLEPRDLGLQLRATLSRNGLVILFVDEPTQVGSELVPFFDAAIRLPLGPARLASATGSLILPCIASYGISRTVTLTIEQPIEPDRRGREATRQIARALEGLIARHLDQWAMLTPIWTATPPPGYSAAELHLHTTGSDGLCEVDSWLGAAHGNALSLLAITDHDHIETVRHWLARAGSRAERVIPGVELTARGRIVHLGVLFFDEVPESLPRPGTPLVECVRWARGISGSVVVLVHPLPLLWRFQLRKLARAGALPDAIETRFPLVGWRSPALERAAADYGLARLGGSDGHLAPAQLGRHATLFPGSTRADLLAAVRTQTTRPVTRPALARPPLALYLLQPLYSWLFPFRHLPGVASARTRLLRAAQGRQPASGVMVATD